MSELYRRSELASLGMGRRALERATRTGALLSVAPGWYSSGDISAEELIAARCGGRLTCLSEARRLGLWIPPGLDERPHVALERGARLGRSAEVRVHWRTGTARRVDAVDRLHVDPLECLRCLVRCQDLETSFVVAESALHRRVIDRAGWRSVLRESPSNRAIALAGAGSMSESGTESLFLYRMRRLGIPVRQQVQIGPDRVDAVVGRGLVVELDSRTHHDPRVDARRDARVGVAGHPTLRFVYEQVWFEWPSVEAAVIAALRRERPRRSPSRRPSIPSDSQ